MIEIKDFYGALINEPGAYRMDDATYRSDPTGSFSLNSTTAKVLIEKSPLHAKRLLEQDPEDEKVFDIGLAAHVMLLERGRTLAIIEASDYRTKAAQEARKAALSGGQLPILQHQHARVQTMLEATDSYIASIKPRPFMDGYAEIAIFAKQDGMWLRALVDWLHQDCLWVDDYKTTDESAAPDAIERRMYSHGWDIQAAMHERILDQIDPDNAGRRKHRFVVQETKEPYVTTVGILSEEAMTMGRKRLNYAINVWQRCLSTDTWPSYPSPVTLGYPRWGETQWLEREVKEGAVPSDILKGG
jgi:hypothetical protein